MSDVETLDSSNNVNINKNKENDKKKAEDVKHDFPSMITDFFKKINFKVAFFLSILTFFILSDFFIESLPNSEYITGDDTNFKGATIQLICIVLGYIIIDLMVQSELL